VIGASIAAPFLPVLLLYLSLTTLYSLVLKRIPIVDIFVLASLYTLRIFAGAAATSITVSPWLLAFSLFFFLGLASVKRYVEFSTSPGASESSRRGYKQSDTTWIGQLGMGTGLISVLVLALYIQAPDVTRLYRNPAGLWLLAPIVLFWIVRVWFLAHRHELHDDPVVFALRDPISLTIGAAAATILLWSM
jgi:4-hydroxybenzoate polyprenyltransferase